MRPPKGAGELSSHLKSAQLFLSLHPGPSVPLHQVNNNVREAAPVVSGRACVRCVGVHMLVCVLAVCLKRLLGVLD